MSHINTHTGIILKPLVQHQSCLFRDHIICSSFPEVVHSFDDMLLVVLQPLKHLFQHLQWKGIHVSDDAGEWELLMLWSVDEKRMLSKSEEKAFRGRRLLQDTCSNCERDMKESGH